LRADLALGCADDPTAVGLLLGGGRGREAMDLSPALTRARGIGHGDAGGIDIPSLRLVHDAAYAIEIDQGVKPFCFASVNLIEIHLVTAGLRLLQPQLMLARFRLREIKGAGLKDTATLAGLLLQLLVKRHRVVLEPADIGGIMETMDVRRGVPGRAGGELVALQQHHLGPAKLGQVIQNGTADQAAADDHCLCMCAHAEIPSWQTPRSGDAAAKRNDPCRCSRARLGNCQTPVWTRGTRHQHLA
jgi:hypothetical protein